MKLVVETHAVMMYGLHSHSVEMMTEYGCSWCKHLSGCPDRRGEDDDADVPLPWQDVQPPGELPGSLLPHGHQAGDLWPVFGWKICLVVRMESLPAPNMQALSALCPHWYDLLATCSPSHLSWQYSSLLVTGFPPSYSMKELVWYLSRENCWSPCYNLRLMCSQVAGGGAV